MWIREATSSVTPGMEVELGREAWPARCMLGNGLCRTEPSAADLWSATPGRAYLGRMRAHLGAINPANTLSERNHITKSPRKV